MDLLHLGKLLLATTWRFQSEASFFIEADQYV